MTPPWTARRRSPLPAGAALLADGRRPHAEFAHAVYFRVDAPSDAEIAALAAFAAACNAYLLSSFPFACPPASSSRVRLSAFSAVGSSRCRTWRRATSPAPLRSMSYLSRHGRDGGACVSSWSSSPAPRLSAVCLSPTLSEVSRACCRRPAASARSARRLSRAIRASRLPNRPHARRQDRSPRLATGPRGAHRHPVSRSRLSRSSPSGAGCASAGIEHPITRRLAGPSSVADAAGRLCGDLRRRRLALTLSRNPGSPKTSLARARPTRSSAPLPGARSATSRRMSSPSAALGAPAPLDPAIAAGQ